MRLANTDVEWIGTSHFATNKIILGQRLGALIECLITFFGPPLSLDGDGTCTSRGGGCRKRNGLSPCLRPLMQAGKPNPGAKEKDANRLNFVASELVRYACCRSHGATSQVDSVHGTTYVAMIGTDSCSHEGRTIVRHMDNRLGQETKSGFPKNLRSQRTDNVKREVRHLAKASPEKYAAPANGDHHEDSMRMLVAIAERFKTKALWQINKWMRLIWLGNMGLSTLLASSRNSPDGAP